MPSVRLLHAIRRAYRPSQASSSEWLPLLACAHGTACNDAVGAFDGGQSVGDNQVERPTIRFVESRLNLTLRFGVEGGSGLVEYQNRRIFQSARAMARRWRWPPESF